MKKYLKILLLLSFLAVAGVKIMTATETDARAEKESSQMPEGPDLRNPGCPYNPGAIGTSLSTSGWLERSGTEWN